MGSFLAAYLNQTKDNRIEELREKFADDPTNAEKLVAHMQRTAVPEKKLEKLGYGANLSKTMAAIPSDDPRRGIGADVMKEFPKVLDAYPGRDPRELLASMYQRRLGEAAEPTYKKIAQDRSTIMNSARVAFGMSPSETYAPIAGYDEWKSATDAARPKEWKWTNPLESMALGAGLPVAGLGLRKIAESAVAKGVGGGLARWGAKRLGEGLVKAPNPWLKIAGAALMAVPEFMAFDIGSNVVKNSEWAQNRSGVVPFVAENAAGLIGAGAVAKSARLIKSALFAREAVQKAGTDLVAMPNATNIIKYGDAATADSNARIVLHPTERTLGGKLQIATPSLPALPPSSYSARSMVDTAVNPQTAIGGIDNIDELLKFSRETGLPLEEVANRYAVQKSLADVTGSAKLTSALKDRPDLIKHTSEIQRYMDTGLDPIQAIREFDKKNATDYWSMRMSEGLDLEKEAGARVLRNGSADEAFTKVLPSTVPNFERAVPNIEQEFSKVRTGELPEVLPETSKIDTPVQITKPASVPSHAEQVRFTTDWMKRVASTPEGEVALGQQLQKVFGDSVDFLNPSNVMKKFKPGSDKAVLQDSFRNLRTWLQEKAVKDVDEITSATNEAIGNVAEIAPPKIVSDTVVKVGDKIKFTNQKGVVHIGEVSRVGKEGIPVVGKGEYAFPLSNNEFELMPKETKPTWGVKGAKPFGMKMVIPAILAGGATIASILGTEDESQAGMLSGVVNKVLVEDAAKTSGRSLTDMLKEFVGKGFWAAPVDAANPKVLPAAMRVPSVKPDLANIAYQGRQKFWMKFFSPGAVADYLYSPMKDGSRIMGSPQPELAARTQAAQMNTLRGKEVFQNIVKDIPGWSNATRAVKKAMKPIVDAGYYDKMEKMGAYKTRIDIINKQLIDFEKQLNKATGSEKQELLDLIGSTRETKRIFQEQFDAMKPEMDKLRQMREPIIRELASQFPSVRVELATRGEGVGSWLDPLLTNEEKEAAGWMRKFYDEYAVRAKEAGERTITSAPYGHFAPHPDVNFSKLIKDVESILPKEMGGYPLAHLNSRAVGSFQVMPELNYVIDHYLPDVNRRLQISQFWKGGWAAHAKQVQGLGFDAVNQYWEGVKRAFQPYEVNGFNKTMRIAYAFETAVRLALSPSVALKHAMKLEAPWSNFGIGETVKLMPTTLNQHFRSVADDIVRSFGGKSTLKDDIATQVMKSWTSQQRLTGLISDLNLNEPIGSLENLLSKFNEKGGMLVNFTEQFDRAHSFLAAMDMAAKKGMTAEQAAYGVMDTILKTNFLSGNHNPEWLRNPKVRMLMMFQGTPFKILEQRVLLAMRAGKSYSDAAKITWEQLQNLKSDVREGEQIFKFNLIKDALRSEKDIYGTPMASQLARKMMILGGMISGAAAVGIDLREHVLHLPGIKIEEGKASLNLNPAITAGLKATQHKEEDYWLSEFFKKWLPSGPIPSILTKGKRLSENDIPEIYRGSQFRYLFGLPSIKEE